MQRAEFGDVLDTLYKAIKYSTKIQTNRKTRRSGAYEETGILQSLTWPAEVLSSTLKGAVNTVDARRPP